MVKKLLDAAKYRASLQSSSSKDQTQVNEAMELSGEVELKPCSNSVETQSFIKIDSEEANPSPKNEGVPTKQQVNDSGEATGSQSSGICNSITQVEMVHSKRMKNLLSHQSKHSIQFNKEKDRILKDLKVKLQDEYSYESARVRKLHLPLTEKRNVEMRNVDKEYIRKQEVIEGHLNWEQKKLESLHKSARREEKELKYHWLEEAKSGRNVDVFSYLPQFLYSYFNLDDGNNCGHSEKLVYNGTNQLQVTGTDNSTSEHLQLHSSINENAAVPHAIQLDLRTTTNSVPEVVRSNDPEGDMILTTKLPTSLPAVPAQQPPNYLKIKEQQRLTKGKRKAIDGENLQSEQIRQSSYLIKKEAEGLYAHDDTKGCNSAQQPPNYLEMKEQQRLTTGKRKAIDLEILPSSYLIKKEAQGSYAHDDTKSGLQVPNDRGHLPPHTGRPDEAKPIANRRSVAQRKRRDREAKQSSHCADIGGQQAENSRKKTTYMPQRTLSRRQRQEREAAQARQCAEMEVKRETNFEEKTTYVSKRSLAQRRRRKREAEQALQSNGVKEFVCVE